MKGEEKRLYKIWQFTYMILLTVRIKNSYQSKREKLKDPTERNMFKAMDRQSPGESQSSREPHEHSPQKEPDKAEQHGQKGPIVSNTAQLTLLKMSLPARAVIRCQRMETQYNGFEKWSHKNDSNSHIQTLDSGGGGEGHKRA